MRPRRGRNTTLGADLLQFDRLMEEALLQGVVRKALTVFAERGIIGQHHFYITFRTNDPSVVLPDHLRARYKPEMTIVLQHQFWGLEVDDNGFAVTLSFEGKHERLKVPWHAVVAFVDPSVQFGLQFTRGETKAEEPACEPKKSEPAQAASKPTAPPSDGDGRVVALDQFRKK
jgi:hypothetical protein